MQHMNQKLAPDIEDVGSMKCGTHGAVLDCATMTYKSGPTWLKGVGTKLEAGAAQPQFTVAMEADGSATLTPPAAQKSSSSCALC